MKQILERIRNTYSTETFEGVSDTLDENSFNKIRNSTDNKEYKFHIYKDLAPTPYIGNLETAKWIFLVTNPSVAGNEYNEQMDPEFKRALKDNISQEDNLEYPFFPLNPKFERTGWYKYWNDKVFIKKQEVSEELRKQLAKDIAVVQLFGFHSRYFSFKVTKPILPKYQKLSHELVEELSKMEKNIVISRRMSWRAMLGKFKYEKSKNDPRYPIFIPQDVRNEYFKKQ